MKEAQKIIILAGPTASGKTSLSLRLAEHLGAEVVNADSMQVYRRMDIGTAKPGAEERKRVVHHLLDVAEPDEEFNAALYRSLALPVLRALDSRGKMGLVVGGTGLYLKSLLGGLFHCPPKDPALRASLQLEYERLGSLRLHERLRLLDPESARKIHPNDHIRVTRALEIIALAKRSPSQLIQEHRFGERAFRALKLCLKVDREILYRRIDERSEKMVKTGLIEETEDLLRNGYSPDLKPMMALGYKHMVRYLRGIWSLEEALRKLARDTRRYAKRQLTWFRADPEMVWVDPRDLRPILDTIKNFLDKTP